VFRCGCALSEAGHSATAPVANRNPQLATPHPRGHAGVVPSSVVGDPAGHDGRASRRV